ncbi:MAG: sortase [Ruthenibacterium sp.]
MKSRRRARLKLCAGALLLIFAGGLCQKNSDDNARAKRACAAMLESAQAQIAAQPPHADVRNPAVRNPAADDGILGILEIPALSLTLPVQADYSEALLQNAPCRYRADPGDTRLIVCGHNYKSQFGRLQTLVPGDAIIFTDSAGNARCYTAVAITTIAQDDPAALTDGTWDLALFTCTLSSIRRVLVRCRAC